MKRRTAESPFGQRTRAYGPPAGSLYSRKQIMNYLYLYNVPTPIIHPQPSEGINPMNHFIYSAHFREILGALNIHMFAKIRSIGRKVLIFSNFKACLFDFSTGVGT